jgi:signal peptidase I
MNPNDPETKEEPEKIYLSEEELPKPGEALKPQTEQERVTAEAKASALAADHTAYNKDIDTLQTPVEDSNLAAEEPPKKRGGLIKELIIWGVVTVAIVLVIQNFIFQAFYVSGSSMEPDYHNNDYLIISKQPITWFSIAKLFGAKNMDIQRGDVLIFRYPNAPETFFIKRAIALPGERVVLKNGKFTIYNKEHPEGFTLSEDYIDPQYVTEGSIDEVIEEGKVFVSGDNRSPGGSFDSRSWGQLDQKFITGFANLRLLPINTFKLLFRPDYSSSTTNTSNTNSPSSNTAPTMTQ